MWDRRAMSVLNKQMTIYNVRQILADKEYLNKRDKKKKRERESRCQGITAYLQQGVPVCYWLSVIGQHFVPVVSPKTLSVQSCSTHSDDFIVSDPVIQRISHFHSNIQR